jgi:hypothetical protein
MRPAQLVVTLGHAVQCRHPPRAHAFVHDLLEFLVAVAARDLRQGGGHPVAIEVVHGEEFVVHAPGYFLGLVGVAGVDGVGEALERELFHLAQFGVREEFFSHAGAPLAR